MSLSGFVDIISIRHFLPARPPSNGTWGAPPDPAREGTALSGLSRLKGFQQSGLISYFGGHGFVGML